MTTLTLLDNRYRVIEALGEGGFGQTFLAEDTQLPSQRRCVIKQLKLMSERPAVYTLVKQRFAREAVVLEALGRGHKQIPDLYAYFTEADRFYLVQEWIAGQSLSELAVSPWSESQVTALLIDVLQVLSYVHSQNIIHRDIKLANIVVDGKHQRPHLIDFGAVKELMSTMVSTGGGEEKSSVPIGTPGYMAPEQAAGRPTFASDIYSLGMTAIRLLTGRSPLEIPTDSYTGQVLWQQYVNASNPALISVLTKAIHPYCQYRFTTANEMLAALNRLEQTGRQSFSASSEPTSAETTHPPPPAPSGWGDSLAQLLSGFNWLQVGLVASIVVLGGGISLGVLRGWPWRLFSVAETGRWQRSDVSKSAPLVDDLGSNDSTSDALDVPLETVEGDAETFRESAQAHLDAEEYDEAIADFYRSGRADPNSQKAFQLITDLSRVCQPFTRVFYTSQALTSPQGNVQVRTEGLLHKHVKEPDKYEESADYCPASRQETLNSKIAIISANNTVSRIESLDDYDEGYVTVQPRSFSPDGRYLVTEVDIGYQGGEAHKGVAIFDLSEGQSVEAPDLCKIYNSATYIGMLGSQQVLVACQDYGTRSAIDVLEVVELITGQVRPFVARDHSQPIATYGSVSDEFTAPL